MTLNGRADALEEYDGWVASERQRFTLPAVVQLRRPAPRVSRAVRYCRLNVYLRDGFRCQYCGSQRPRSELTLDHVVPRSSWTGPREQLTDWGNIVTSCWPCNQRKRNRTPAQAGMRLLRRAVRPAEIPPMPFFMPDAAPACWIPYLPTAVRRVA